MKKITIYAVLALFSGVLVSYANDVFWGVQQASAFTWYDHNGVAMDGTPSSSAYLIQLIYAGADGIIDPINLSDADGTGGNDQMVAFSRFGNATVPRTDGKIEAGPYLNSLPNNSTFYMRAWEGISAGSGAIPAGVAWYGNSMTFKITGFNSDPALENADSFYATADLGGSSGTYAMQPVPEPTTIALLGMGLALIGLRRRIAK